MGSACQEDDKGKRGREQMASKRLVSTKQGLVDADKSSGMPAEVFTGDPRSLVERTRLHMSF